MTSIASSPDAEPWLSIVGIGEGGMEALSPRAARLLDAAETVFGGSRHLANVPKRVGQERIAWPSPLEEALPWINARRGRPVCVLASGDPFWYGIGATLVRTISPHEMDVVPAPSAFSLAAARMGWPLQETHCLSVHGRALNRVRPWLHDGERLLVLSWDGTTPAALAGFLTASGFGSSRLTVWAHMDGSREHRCDGRAETWGETETAALNTVAVECCAGGGAAGIAAVPGRPEADFDHDGQISKREIRAVTLAHLAPGRGERLWEIGAGSGAVGIEWMLADPGNRVVALEPNPVRAERIRTNARAFGVPELECVQAAAPEGLAELPRPDAIFIGGGLTTPGLLAACWAALPRGGRLVANSVTLEGDAVLAEAVQDYGGVLVRLAVSYTEALGDLTGWTARRPVTLWSGVRP